MRRCRVLRPRGLDVDRSNFIDSSTLGLLIIRCDSLVILSCGQAGACGDPGRRIPAASEIGRDQNDEDDHNQEEYDEDLADVALVILLLTF